MGRMSDESLAMITGNEPPLNVECDGCACRDDEIQQLREALVACHHQMGVNMVGKDREFVLAYNKADEIVGPKNEVNPAQEKQAADRLGAALAPIFK